MSYPDNKDREGYTEHQVENAQADLAALEAAKANIAVAIKSEVGWLRQDFSVDEDKYIQDMAHEIVTELLHDVWTDAKAVMEWLPRSKR